MSMKTITLSEAEHDLVGILHMVVDDAEAIVIRAEDGREVVLLPLGEYSSWKETEYLLSNPVNAAHLRKSIEDARNGKTIEMHDGTDRNDGVVVTDVKVDAHDLILTLSDARRLTIPLDWYPRLIHATSEERSNWNLLGGGYAVEWPDLDEHIGIEGLLAGRRSGESDASLSRWLESRASSKHS
jgi:PHD/YefM family antitoxin component YafN of YafNO toxin-antitoxin module